MKNIKNRPVWAPSQPSDHSLRAGAQTVWLVLELALRGQGCQAVAQPWDHSLRALAQTAGL